MVRSPDKLLPLGICPVSLRRLVDLAWPVVGLNVLNVLALAVDTAMLGRVPDSEAALTGLGFGVQVIFLAMVAMIGLTVGAVAMVSRAHGARDPARVERVFGQAMLLAVGLGLGVAVGGNLLAPALLDLLGADAVGRQAGLDYLRPLLAGSSFTYLSLMLAAVLRGVGNTRLALWAALASNALNFLANYGLILGNFGLPALGIRGAALGTVCAQVLSCALLLGFVHRGAVPLLRLPRRWPGLDQAPALVRIGMPAALDMLVLNAGFLTIVGLLGRLDPLAVAAHGVGLRIQALAFVPGMAISQATGALVGQALGAGDAEEARRVVRSSVALCFGVMSTLGLAIVLAIDPLLWAFSVDPAGTLGSHARTWMTLLGICMPIVGVYIAYVGTFQGAGATRLSLRINSVATLVVQIPLSWVFGFPLGLGVFGVWLAFPLSFVVKGLWGVVAYRQGSWARLGAR